MDRRTFISTAAAMGAGIALKPLSAMGTTLSGGVPMAGEATWSGLVRLTGPIVIPGGGSQAFDPSASTTVEIDCGGGSPNAGLILEGVLRMRPGTPGVTHTLRFVNVNESTFRGGGEAPLTTDPGLWIRPGGVLDAQGSQRLPWTRAVGSIPAGANSCQLEVAPTGWAIGDELLFVPCDAWRFTEAFEVRTVTAIVGATVSFSPLAYPHPVVQLPNGRIVNPEVVNLTRNVQIEGTPSGRSHVHAFGAGRQALSQIGLRYMGLPVQGNPDRGRYALHFHHCEDGTRGTFVDGVVVRSHGSHAFVPHMSHGISFRDCVSYDGVDPFWWDRLDPDGMVVQTHDTVYERCVAARATGVGFLHTFGMRNAARNCVAVGITGAREGHGYFWPASPRDVPRAATVWTWQDNIAHNNNQGVRVWENTSQETHLIERPVAYHNFSKQIFWGAYRNPYDWSGGAAMGPRPVELAAVSSTTRSEWRGLSLDAAGSVYALVVSGHSLPAGNAQLVEAFDFRGFSTAAIQFIESGSQPSRIDFVRCTVGGTRPLATSDLVFTLIHPASVVRIQTAAGAWRKTGAGPWTSIGTFA
jgi:hypothetical protein